MQTQINSSNQPFRSESQSGVTYSEPVQNTSVQNIVPGEWATAPTIIKGWAWPLAMIGAFVLPASAYLPFVARLCVGIGSVPVAITFVLWIIDLFLVYALRNGLKAGWYVQAVMSVLKLRYLPFGTLMHGYLLSQWFKPEVKQWFGVR